MTDDDVADEGRPLVCAPLADRYIAEWITGLSLLWRKKLRRREAMRPQGPASNEALANVPPLVRAPLIAPARGTRRRRLLHVLLRWPRRRCQRSRPGPTPAAARRRHHASGGDLVPAAAQASVQAN
jgi:hypothetical protein